MTLDINEKYKIESDNYEYQLIEKGTVKEGINAGKETEKIIAHCGSLEYAFKLSVDKTVKTSKALNDLGQVLKEVNQIKADIDKVLEPLKYEK